MRYITRPIFLSLLHLGLAAAQVDDAWPAYGGDPGGMKYSPLRQINGGERNAV